MRAERGVYILYAFLDVGKRGVGENAYSVQNAVFYTFFNASAAFFRARGTPFGTFVPTMKISTNSNLAKNKPNWIDFNAGALVEGVEMKDLVSKFIDKIIAVASGEEARNEYNGYREISIFKNGVTL